MKDDRVQEKRKVLVIDDEENIRKMIRRLLERWAYDVKESADGEEAVAELGKSQFDLLICDIRMPRKNGWEVLETVKSSPKTSSVPVIVLTGMNDDDDMLKCYESGAEYYISKPFTPSQLLYGVRMMFGEAEECWKA